MSAGKREPETSGPSESVPGRSPFRLMPGMAEILAAWVEFYDANYHRVVRFIMHDGASLQDAQDAAQEAFAESWALMDGHPHRWLEIISKEAWIRVVALRRYRRPPGSRIRVRLAEEFLIPELPQPGPEPGELTAQIQMVLHALRNLDERERSVMAFYLDDFPTTAIAEALNLTQQEVRDIKKKARAALKAALAGNMSAGRRQL